MKTRIISGTFMAILALAIFYLGGIYVKGAAAILLGIGMYELLGLFHKKNWSMIIDLVLYIYAFYIMFFDKGSEMFSGSIFFLMLLVLLFLSLVYESFSIHEVFFLASMTTFLAVAGKSLILVDSIYHFAGMIYIAFANFGCDTGAYFVGVKFGKHKLIPRVSPKKTIEGSVGGMITGTLLATGAGYFLNLNLPVIEMVVLAFFMTIFAQIGDLTFSAIKRYFNVKDYSNLIPGHGGVLDRVDSLLFNILAFCLWLTIFH